MPTTARDRYTIGRLGSYDTSTVARVDSHLRALRVHLGGPVTARQAANTRWDVDLLLDARSAMTQVPA